MFPKRDDDPPPRRWRLCGKMAGWPAPGPKDRGPTEGQERRRKRNLLIALARANGLSTRWIAEALDLAPSRVQAILDEFKGAWVPRGE